MADVMSSSSFTERILRRAVARRKQDQSFDLNNSREFSERRNNILKAIKDPSDRPRSVISLSDSQSFDSSRDSFNLTGISFSNNNNNNDEKAVDAYRLLEKHDNKFDNKYSKNSISRVNENSEKSSNLEKSMDNSEDKSFVLEDNSEEELEKLLGESVDTSEDLGHELNNSKPKNPNENSVEIRLTRMSEELKASMTVIDDSEDDSELHDPPVGSTFTTKAVIEMCNRVYNALDIDYRPKEPKNSDIKLPQRAPRPKSTGGDWESIEHLGGTLAEVTAPEPPLNSKFRSPGKLLFPSPSKSDSLNSDGASLGAFETLPNKWQGVSLVGSLEYDEKKFLEEALGDELFGSSVTFDDSRPRSGSDFTASDLVSEKLFYPEEGTQEKTSRPSSNPCSPRSPGTLDRSLRMCRSLSQRIKRRFRPSVKAKPEPARRPTITSGSEEIDLIQDLLQEVKTQQTSMNEAARILQLCDLDNDSHPRSERLDAERRLLTASLKRKAALEEIKSITSDEIPKENIPYREKAEVTVSNFSLELREPQKNSFPVGEEPEEWCLVAVSQGLNVWVTSAKPCPENASILKFDEAISIPNLNPRFKISVQVFCLRVPGPELGGGRPRSPKYSLSSSCLPYSELLASPTKLFRKHEDNSRVQGSNNVWRTRSSGFVLSGSMELDLKDLAKCSTWSLTMVPTNSRLKGTLDLSLECRLTLKTSHEGFLNFYEEIGGSASWNRRWCVLQGHTLMFWNYPREQDVKEPMKSIELVHCVSNEITNVDRSICPKPRTLLVETVRRREAGDRDSVMHECSSSSTYVRNLLSFDTVKELEEWSCQLNHVLLALEEWNIIGQRTQPRVSDL